jgi:pimeloyl-ACP methyl ester carboxylesterase
VATEVLPFVYLRLRWRLRAAGYRVHYWPFDWRLSPTSNAARLIQELAAAGSAPIHLVAHSQGGLVAAHALAEDRNARWLARAVTLGTPFLGAHAAQQALEGEAPLLQRLAWLDPHHTAKDLARSPLATWPGLQALLPIANDASSYSAKSDPRLGCLAATGRNTRVLNAAGQLEATDAGDGTVAVASALAPTLAPTLASTLASSQSTGSAATASVTLPVGFGSHGTLPAMPATAQQVVHFLQHSVFAPPRDAEAGAQRQAVPVVASTDGWEAMGREANGASSPNGQRPSTVPRPTCSRHQHPAGMSTAVCHDAATPRSSWWVCFATWVLPAYSALWAFKQPPAAPSPMADSFPILAPRYGSTAPMAAPM